MLEGIKNEPALVVALISAMITLATAFGLELSKEQAGAIILVTNAVLSIVVRRQVTPTRKISAPK